MATIHDPLTLPRRIPVADRAEGEPDQEGYFLQAVLERVSPPEMAAEYRAKLLDVPRLAEKERRDHRAAGVPMLPAGFFKSGGEEEIITETLRAPMKSYVFERWREGRVLVFGFCHETNRREKISASSREYLNFDGANADNTKKHYEDVLFYLVDDEPASQSAEIVAAPRAASATKSQIAEKPPMAVSVDDLAAESSRGTKAADPRNRSAAMHCGLQKALTAGLIEKGKRVSLTAAYKAMLDALGHKGEAPRGMGADAFAKHCRAWLTQNGIY